MNIKTINYKDITTPPGGILLWIIIYLELITFGFALVALAYSSRENPELYHRSRLMLNSSLGVLNTIFLLTSGFCMAMTVKFFKQQEYKKSSQFTLASMILGVMFLFVKAIEYNSKIEAGLDITYNTFFTYYWLLTLFHVIHVLVGLVILLFIYFGLKKKTVTTELEDVEAGAAFWHMCDLIWLLLFPVLYLIL